MNRANALIVILFLSVILTPPSVIAQTNQGLEWGFTPSDEYYFMMHVDADDMLIDEEIFFNSSDTLPMIPDSLNNWTDIPYVVMDAYYANGTDIGALVLIFLAAHNIQLPIGNWSLMSSIYSSTLEVDHFELDASDPYFWGYSWDDDNWEYGWVHAAEGLTLVVHVDYFKEDGYLSHYFVESYNTTTEEKTGELELNRIGMEPYRDKTAPILNHPDDITYFEDEGPLFRASIIWTPSDDYPLSYEVFVDGTTLISGDWNSSSESITVPVWGLEAGEYNYTIEVSDFAGNTAVDTVMVTVQAPDIFAGPMLYIIIAGVIVLLVVVAVAFRKLLSR